MVLTCRALASWYVQQELVAAEVDETLSGSARLWDAHWANSTGESRCTEPSNSLSSPPFCHPTHGTVLSVLVGLDAIDKQTNALDFLE